MEVKTPEQITNDILKSINNENAPERVLILPYLESCINNIKKVMLEEIYHKIDICCISETDQVKMQTISDIFVKYGADAKNME